ncbi:hypothetical protein A3H65_02395 [Candidatus Giovannonibacteria bacterium RIFCSPLOWO2_02_FULL_45_14]|uniref:Uncharacterized protein n=1 Tax=Candidatus Giovannonibacteria bacterium RIFCSPLOWO2_12_FULL_44_15 TaxID=1798364 RepID=A0A1F5Y1B1_9BACT|nr:MAG: hypothetical protein A3C75_00130 [Candidatus Giovannonibacteria bacterium RIFCSPHIGHO2_02_FULL_44_31]OGF75925.1 MAG: hypothetical protein A3E62_00450 [Candidatus Giovannonibacteria bacterium RIFCSPHIGHO2_12_FULL_44_29]OGF91265.1 MAG: hypothetical protein A3H65_02395 [Candidatus Giovannonibacteria bacterium RIFCSPLOWO2_02_FULL_45_14]OGF93836.1 MAG: hypothetical protein A3G54_03690 [Candidatus Giovannonibacteria bacterium RIFCSPLOWO2_12_FULL_44_15]
MKKTSISIISVAFFLITLGFARAEEEVIQPESYKDRVLPGVMIVMERGNTIWGTCKQIEIDGNLPFEKVKDHMQCTKMVAENHTGLTGDAAMEATKKIQVGEPVFFPYLTVAQIVAANEAKVVAAVQAKDQEILARDQQIAEFKTQNGVLQAKLKNASTKLEKQAATISSLKGVRDEALRRASEFGDVVNGVVAVYSDTVKSNAEIWNRVLAAARPLDYQTELPYPWLEGSEGYLFGLAIVACTIFWAISWAYRTVEHPRITVLLRENTMLRAQLESHDAASKKGIERFKAELAKNKPGATEEVSIGNAPDVVKRVFTLRHVWECACGEMDITVMDKEDHRKRHLKHMHLHGDKIAEMALRAL